MTLDQLALVRRWHVQHRHGHPVEFQAWDLILTAWVAGWTGSAAALVLHTPFAALGCLLLLFVPGAYVGWRRRLHRRGKLRCDWLGALRREP